MTKRALTVTALAVSSTVLAAGVAFAASATTSGTVTVAEQRGHFFDLSNSTHAQTPGDYIHQNFDGWIY